jgi:hypothetical protein
MYLFLTNEAIIIVQLFLLELLYNCAKNTGESDENTLAM